MRAGRVLRRRAGRRRGAGRTRAAEPAAWGRGPVRRGHHRASRTWCRPIGERAVHRGRAGPRDQVEHAADAGRARHRDARAARDRHDRGRSRRWAPDGLFLSNGPGDPATADAPVALTRQVLERRIPLFGICFGNQILGRALGRGTYKLRYGHRGINIPVVEHATGRVAITSQNHGFAVRGRGGGAVRHPVRPRPRSPTPAPTTAASRACAALDVPAFSVQYHPEAAAGPHDAADLFDRFVELMDEGPLMPRRDDIKHVLVIGSGPIVIGQACEFDYSGTQACRVLREEGIRVSLVNSNPATIMTDPEFADATYIEPITPEFVEQVIAARSGPDAHPGHPGRADRAEHRDRAARARGAGEVRRRADRRRHRRHPARRGPAEVQGDRASRSARDVPRSRGLPLDGRGARGRRRARAAGGHPAVVHHGRAGLRHGAHRRRPGAARRRRAGRVAGAPRC